MLNTNEIEKVSEKQLLKSESSPNLSAEEASTEENLSEENLAEDILAENEMLASDLAADLGAEDLAAGTADAVGALAAAPGTQLPIDVLDPNADNYSDFDVDSIDNILELKADQFPRFTLAKNKARFLRMVSDYRSKQEWLDVAPLSGVTKLFKQQTKELVGIRAKKLDYEMEIEMGTLTPVQISHRRDELKMCKVQEKMAVSLISKMQVKIRSGRR